MARQFMRQKPVKTSAEGRFCKVCGKTLSIYNKSNQCFHHANHNEIEQVSIPKKEKIQMAPKEKQKCEMCGNDKEVRSNNEKMVCSSCTVIQGAAKLRPNVVISAVRDFHGNPFRFLTPQEIEEAIEKMKKKIGVADPAVFCNLEDIAALTKERDELKQAVVELQEIRKGLQEQTEAQARDIQALHLRAVDLERNLRESVEESISLSRDNQNLKVAIGELKISLSEKNDELQKAILSSSANTGIDKAKLLLLLADIGQGVVDGKKRLSGRVYRELRKLAA